MSRDRRAPHHALQHKIVAGEARHVLRSARLDRAVADGRRAPDHVNPTELEWEVEPVEEIDVHETGGALDEGRPRLVVLGDRRVRLQVDVHPPCHVGGIAESECEALGLALARLLGLPTVMAGIDVGLRAGDETELDVVRRPVGVVLRRRGRDGGE